MASYSLYPVTVESTSPAFVADGDAAYCRVYFSLSRFSSSTDSIRGVHVSVTKQSSGQSVVRKVDNTELGRYRSSGLILINSAPTPVQGKTNLYYIDVLNEDILSGDDVGWASGWIYKIQVRLSTVTYAGEIGQTAWLNANANNFSEWSTYCTTKAISKPILSVPIMKNFNSDTNSNSSNTNKTYNLSISTLDFDATYSNADASETLYSYILRLYDDTETLIEESDVIYTNQYYNPNAIHYTYKHEFEDGYNYIVELEYTTINKYTETYTFNIEINQLSLSDDLDYSLITAETLYLIGEGKEESDLTSTESEFKSKFNSATTLYEEEEEGRIGLKLYSPTAKHVSANFCIRRSSSKDNFSTWDDIKIIVCIDTSINDLPMFFDNTIESGVYYKYGVQTIETNGDRDILQFITIPILREFQYSFLIGEGGKQLKLRFDNTMNNYTYNYLEQKTDTIGGQFPYITRNGNTKYRSFPVNGLISYTMDENEIFTNDEELYPYAGVRASYVARRRSEAFGIYDFKKEFDFREKVLAFLQDGKPKLFKSATEGNIIVRLMQVAAQPNQTLNRMICSFTSTAYEVAEDTLENYLKYGFYEVGDYATSFATYSTKLGQLEMDFSVGDNVIEKIWDKYDFSNRNMAGYRLTTKTIQNLSIEFTDKPLRVYNNAYDEVLGNNILYEQNKITVTAETGGKYLFDERVTFSKGSSLIILGGLDDEYNSSGENITTVHATVNFYYVEKKDKWEGKKIATRSEYHGIGQYRTVVKPNKDIIRDLYYKYYYEWLLEYRRLNRVAWAKIEANPGAVFRIVDSSSGEDTTSNSAAVAVQTVVMNYTGVLDLGELFSIQKIQYLGMMKSDGTIDTTQNCDIVMDYLYYTIEGTYESQGDN